MKNAPVHGRLRRLRHYILVMFLLAIIAYSGFSLFQWTQANRAIDAARAALNLTDFDVAKRNLDQASRLRPDSADVQLLLAEWARRSGKLEDMDAYLHACQKLGGIPEAIELEQMLARTQLGKLQDEAMLLALADQKHPQQVQIYEALAAGCMVSYHLAQAAQYLDRVLDVQPDCKRALAWKGDVLYRLRTKANAIEAWKKLIAIDPDNDEARLKLAGALVEESFPAEALVHYEHLRGKGNTGAAVANGLARSLSALGREDEARDVLDASLRQHPRDAESLLLRGRVDFNRGRAELAEPYLRKAAEIAPFDRETTYTLGQCLSQTGKKDEAKVWLDRHQQIQEDQRRLTKLTRATADNPRDPATRTEAGVIFLRNGNATEGLRWLQSALHESPDYAPAHLALARHYRDAGLFAQAELHERAAVAKKAP